MRIRWTEYAIAQMTVLADGLAEHRGTAAQKRIIDRLLERVEALADLPWAAPPWAPAGNATFRRLVVDEHIVLYRVIEDDATVFILAVRHGRLRPLEPEDVPSE